MVETYAILVVDEVTDINVHISDKAVEVVEADAHIVDEVATTNSVPITNESIATVDTEVMALASTEPSVHTDREFLGGPDD